MSDAPPPGAGDARAQAHHHAAAATGVSGEADGDAALEGAAERTVSFTADIMARRAAEQALPMNARGQSAAESVGTSEETQLTMMLRKQNEVRVLAEALATTRVDYAARMAALGEREAMGKTKSAEMEAMVVRLRPFIEENDVKQRKALEKAAAEEAARAVVAAEVARHVEEVQRARGEEAEMQAELKKLGRFHAFLQSVVTAVSAVRGGGVCWLGWRVGEGGWRRLHAPACSLTTHLSLSPPRPAPPPLLSRRRVPAARRTSVRPRTS
jgi:hypothetical protein